MRNQRATSALAVPATVLEPVVAGLLRFRTSVPHMALRAMLLLLWCGVHVVYFGLSRFHLPLLPLLAVVAAAGVIARMKSSSEMTGAGRADGEPWITTAP